jgi:hypothetical protein
MHRKRRYKPPREIFNSLAHSRNSNVFPCNVRKRRALDTDLFLGLRGKVCSHQRHSLHCVLRPLAKLDNGTICSLPHLQRQRICTLVPFDATRSITVQYPYCSFNTLLHSQDENLPTSLYHKNNGCKEKKLQEVQVMLVRWGI